MYAVPAREQKHRITELLDLVDFLGREKERVEGYSRGMRQRLHIARGLLHRPDVLFLDEPSIGVDPVAARDLRRTVADLAAAGTTVPTRSPGPCPRPGARGPCTRRPRAATCSPRCRPPPRSAPGTPWPPSSSSGGWSAGRAPPRPQALA
ncbi:ATP-binding cassette domain-containing protein [Streptomyces sp. NPDC057020]|uniref:ATP-binding cassette domain-containing protein n=1 Tax=unclassified Streptomyces TaxID=2593676 RepID=UPI00363F4D03